MESQAQEAVTNQEGQRLPGISGSSLSPLLICWSHDSALQQAWGDWVPTVKIKTLDTWPSPCSFCGGVGMPWGWMVGSFLILYEEVGRAGEKAAYD